MASTQTPWHWPLAPVFAALILIGSLLSTDAAQAQEVQVSVEPEAYSVQYFDPKHLPNPPPPLPAGEQAVTDWKFHVGTHFNFAILRHDEKPGACQILAKITEDQLILKLQIIIYLPTGANPKLVAHEEGHRRIVQTIYKDAYAITNECGNSILGKEYSGAGADKAAAEHDAVAKMSKEVSACIMQKMNARCARVSEEFDRITGHGNKPIAVDEAIGQAFANTR